MFFVQVEIVDNSGADLIMASLRREEDAQYRVIRRNDCGVMRSSANTTGTGLHWFSGVVGMDICTLVI